jgi:hypothetical protein
MHCWQNIPDKAFWQKLYSQCIAAKAFLPEYSHLYICTKNFLPKHFKKHFDQNIPTKIFRPNFTANKKRVVVQNKSKIFTEDYFV